MTTSRLHLLWIVSAVFILLAVLMGCSHTKAVKAPSESIYGQEQADVILLKVGLVLNRELRVAEWQGGTYGSLFFTGLSSGVRRIPLGKIFIKNSKKLMRRLFADVIVGNSKTDFTAETVDAIVTPTMVTAEETYHSFAFGDDAFTVILEWEFRDNNDRLIWIDTVPGTGSEEDGKKRVKGAIDSLFRNSYDAISNAKEIRDLVQENEN